MKFAILNGVKSEPQPGLSGECPGCGKTVTAKCGEQRIWHWAHKTTRHCDHWWEPETEWHRSWKANFPADWQEVIHRSANNEKHIADVRTSHGWTIEFQNSFLDPEERRSRDAFYPKLVWVVNGLRRKRDFSQFTKVVERRVPINSKVFQVSSDDCALLREWQHSATPVFLDFGEQNLLWLLLPRTSSDNTYVTPYARYGFVAQFCNSDSTAVDGFGSFMDDFPKLLEGFLAARVRQHSPYSPFQAHVHRMQRLQRRF